MNLAALFSAETPIPLHALVAILAIVLGGLQMALPKGGARHRAVGGVFMVAMAVVALSAVWIHEIRLWGRWSPIHLLIPVTVFGLWDGWRAARAGNIAAHRRAMIALYVAALVVTGAFTLLPGRTMHTVLFG
jgi:uncharacterized membrane protein